MIRKVGNDFLPAEFDDELFRQLQPKSVGVCHFTWVEKYAEIIKKCETHVFTIIPETK